MKTFSLWFQKAGMYMFPAVRISNDIHPLNFFYSQPLSCFLFIQWHFRVRRCSTRRMPFLILIQIIKCITNELQMLFYSLFVRGSFVLIAVPYNTVFYCVSLNPFLVNDKRRQQVVFCHFSFFQIPCQEESATTYVILFFFGMERHGKRSEIWKIAKRLVWSNWYYLFDEAIVYHKSVWLWLLRFTCFS